MGTEFPHFRKHSAQECICFSDGLISDLFGIISVANHHAAMHIFWWFGGWFGSFLAAWGGLAFYCSGGLGVCVAWPMEFQEQVDTLAYNTVLAALPWDQGLALLVTQAAPDAAGFGAVRLGLAERSVCPARGTCAQ